MREIKKKKNKWLTIWTDLAGLKGKYSPLLLYQDVEDEIQSKNYKKISVETIYDYCRKEIKELLKRRREI